MKNNVFTGLAIGKRNLLARMDLKQLLGSFLLPLDGFENVVWFMFAAPAAMLLETA